MLQASFIHLLFMIIVANASPIITRKLFHNKWNHAIDGGVIFIDGQPLLGNSKTWRGIIGSVIITSIVGVALGYSIQTGALISLLAMTGDLSSSFIKRRLSMPISSMAPLLDQIPESFLPAIIMMQSFKLSLSSVSILVVLFIIFELGASIILYKWGIRKHPY
jgi:CDP-2,3-bis-(O-geranylgeranyl)-sn-glycerol synthase